MITREINVAQSKKMIKEKWEKTNLSVIETSDRLGVTPQALYKWMSPNNKYLPGLDNCIGLCQIFDCRVEEFIIWE